MTKRDDNAGQIPIAELSAGMVLPSMTSARYHVCHRDVVVRRVESERYSVHCRSPVSGKMCERSARRYKFLAMTADGGHVWSGTRDEGSSIAVYNDDAATPIRAATAERRARDLQRSKRDKANDPPPKIRPWSAAELAAAAEETYKKTRRWLDRDLMGCIL